MIGQRGYAGLVAPSDVAFAALVIKRGKNDKESCV